MLHKRLKVAFPFFLLVTLVITGVWGAKKEISPRQAYMEMQINLTWLSEGLVGLGKSKNKSLALTMPQKRNILSVYKEFQTRKIIFLSSRDLPRDWFNDREKTKEKDHPSQKTSSSSGDKKDEVLLMVDFANKGITRIEGFLTPMQIRWIDNLDFDPKKYGLREKETTSTKKEKTGTKKEKVVEEKKATEKKQSDSTKKREEGLSELFRLNQEVLKLLSSS